MLTIKKLKELIKDLPDDAMVKAYEGEVCGLNVYLGDKYGWIETGWSCEEECDHGEHNLDDIRQS